MARGALGLGRLEAKPDLGLFGALSDRVASYNLGPKFPAG
jgi:hypothetical protein